MMVPRRGITYRQGLCSLKGLFYSEQAGNGIRSM